MCETTGAMTVEVGCQRGEHDMGQAGTSCRRRNARVGVDFNSLSHKELPTISEHVIKTNTVSH